MRDVIAAVYFVSDSCVVRCPRSRMKTGPVNFICVYAGPVSSGVEMKTLPVNCERARDT